jgi:hypothetical protein
MTSENRPGGGNGPVTPDQAREILEALAEHGTPPDYGTEHFSVGCDPILEALDGRYFANLLRRGKSALKLVEGRYGGGKTHFLVCARTRAGAGGYPSCLVQLRPRECSYEQPLGIYRGVAGAVSAPGNNDAACRGIDKLLEQRLQAQREAMGDTETSEWLQSTLRCMPAESASYRSAVVAYMKALLDGETASSDRLAKYLRGESVPSAELREFGVYERIGNGNAFRMLRTLCRTVREIGFPGVLVLFDEVDRLLSSRRFTKAGEALVDTLRDLVDMVGRHELPGTMFLVAVPVREFWDLANRYQALTERLRSPFPFGPDHPLAPVIRLDRLGMEEEELLRAVGKKLAHLSEIMTGAAGDGARAADLDRLAALCLERRMDIGNRRLFVKSAALLLTSTAPQFASPVADVVLSDLVSSTARSLADGPDGED